MLDFHHLNVFLKAAQKKSFSKAADELFLSQSTVSTHIQSLENNLDVKLFDRIGKEIILTSAGEKLYSRALELMALRDKAVYDISAYSSSIKGSLEIASSTVPGQYILPGIIGEFHKLYPDVVCNVFQENSKQVSLKLLEGKCEIGFLGAKYSKDKLTYIPVAEDELVVIFPAYYSCNDYAVNYEEILQEKFITRNYGSGTRSVFEEALSKKGYAVQDLHIAAAFDSTEAVKQAVKYGLGIAVVSKRAACDYVTSGYLKSCSLQGLDLKRNFYVAFHRERTMSPICEKFLQYVKEYYYERNIC